MSKRYKQLKFKAWDISKPLPVKPEPNTVFIIKDEDEFIIEVVDSKCNYLSHKSYGESVYGIVNSVVGGTDITIDNTDPKNPIINSTASGGGSATQSDWGYYATNIEYTDLTGIIPTGQVLTGEIDNVTVYRFISTAQTGLYPTEDSFYSTFDGTTLSDLITTR